MRLFEDILRLHETFLFGLSGDSPVAGAANCAALRMASAAVELLGLDATPGGLPELSTASILVVLVVNVSVLGLAVVPASLVEEAEMRPEDGGPPTECGWAPKLAGEEDECESGRMLASLDVTDVIVGIVLALPL